MKIFDISRSLSNDLAPWPGDTPFHFESKWKMAEGATVNVGAALAYSQRADIQRYLNIRNM